MSKQQFTLTQLKAMSKTSWPFNGHIFVDPKDLPPQNNFRILSKLEKHRLSTQELETYKAGCLLAEMKAPTELEKENLRNEANRVNSQINERLMGVRY